MDREGIENEVLGEELATRPDYDLCFGDSVMDEVAYLLSSGQTKERIREAVNLTRGQLERIISQLRAVYLEEGKVQP